MLKKIISILVGITVLLTMSTSAFASSENNVTYSHMFYNEETKETEVVAENDYKRYQEIPILSKEEETIYRDSETLMSRVLYPVLTSYSQTKKTIDNAAFYSGAVSGDNRNSVAPMKITYKTYSSGTARVGATVSATVSADFDLIIAKVNSSVTIGGTASRSWSKGITIGSSFSIPPGMQGKLTAYIPGTRSSGTGKYKIYNSSDSSYFTDSWGIGAKVPCKSNWHIKSATW